VEIGDAGETGAAASLKLCPELKASGIRHYCIQKCHIGCALPVAGYNTRIDEDL
jgi:hypothetical protein